MSETALISSTLKANLIIFGSVDLTVSIDEKQSDCTTLVFTVTLRVISPVVSPVFASASEALIFPTFNTHVEVLIYDDCGNIQLIRLEFPASGDDQAQTVALNLPTSRCNIPAGDWDRTYFVLADPFNKLAEAKEGNNFAKFTKHCIG